LPRTATVRVAELVVLGGAVALGGIVALALATIGPAAATATGDVDRAVTVGQTSAPVATSVSFTVDLWADVPAHDATHLVVRGQMDFVHHTMTAVVTVPRSALRSRSSASNAAFLPADNTVNLHSEWVDGHAYMTVPSWWSGLAKGAKALSLPTSSSMHRTIDTALAQSAVALTYANILLGQLADHHAVKMERARTIGGVRATGTKVDLALAQLVKLVPELSPTLTKDAATMGSKTIPTTVWVDHRGRLVEATMRSGEGDDASVIGTVQFSHYDAPVTITRPTASTVKPLPTALRQLLDGLYLF
jgi:hypothetical protein